MPSIGTLEHSIISEKGWCFKMRGNNKITLLFPGQGSQYSGMGKDLYDNHGVVREIYELANQVLGYDLPDLCFKKSILGKAAVQKRDLDKTIHTQPAVLATSYACFRVLQEACKERKIKLNIALLAGHSLGEYTGLLVSGAIDFETCLCLVKKRATYMSQVGEGYPGAGLMAIVSKNGGLDYDQISSMCKDFGVYITLNNTKRQIVVGGSKRQLMVMSKELRKEDTSVTMLKVEGPFHTPIMKPAAARFRKELEKSNISIASIPVVANVSAEAIVDPNHIRTELYSQIFRAVHWRRSVEKIIGAGGDLFIEVGPKKVLTRMLKDIDPSVRSLNIEDSESLENAVAELAKMN
jgi:[acyl-carrier-protein] S-malonyltransferase